MTTDIYASMRYRDALAAIDWLERAFGFERHVVYQGDDGTVDHAELRYGEGLVMLGSVRGEDDHRRPGQGWAYVAVDDLSAHHERARAARRRDRRRASSPGLRSLLRRPRSRRQPLELRDLPSRSAARVLTT